MTEEGALKKLRSINARLESGENNRDSLESAYMALGDIAEAQPQLADKVIKTFGIGLQSNKNDLSLREKVNNTI